MTMAVESVLLAIVFLASGAVFERATGLQDGARRSTEDGVYTPEQAQRGARIWGESCLRCHQADDFKGSYLRNWAGNTARALYESIAGTMPEERPGSLKPQEYADILAYLFGLNEFPSGKEELKGDKEALGAIVIERRPK
jgi:mono/diheme cytochrome c family protein